MIPPLKPGAQLPQANGPVIETERLILRQWRAADIAANTVMLGDPLTARFITADRKPVTDRVAGWRNAAIMAGHWVLHGFGMFVVEEKASGTFVGRVGPWYPPGWPGFEVGWGVDRNSAARATPSKRRGPSIDWSFATFELEGSSTASMRETSRQAVARRLGARQEGESIYSAMPLNSG